MLVVLKEKYSDDMRRMFDILFGAEVFHLANTERGHFNLSCSPWVDVPDTKTCPKSCRELQYKLHPPPALAMLRQGDTSVTVKETAEFHDDKITVVSIAENKGGSLAKSTTVRVDFTIKNAERGGCEVEARIDYQFKCNRVVAGMVERVMRSEMERGYKGFMRCGKDYAEKNPAPASVPE